MAITNQEIHEILDGQDVSALLNLIDSPNVDEEQRADFIASILTSLEELFYEELPELVVRVCIEVPEKIAWAARHNFLSPWLRREGFKYRSEVIKQIILRLRYNEEAQIIAALRTAWVVGYRDEELQQELIRIAGLHDETHANNDSQGYALTVLSSLAYTDQKAITQKLKSRLAKIGNLTEPDCWTAIYAATPEMIPDLCQAAPSHIIAVDALLKLPSRYPDAALDVLNAFKSLDRRDRFLYSSTIAQRINLEEVGAYLLTEVLEVFQQYKSRNALPPVGSLLGANLPNHIYYFIKAREFLSPDEREWLKVPAVTATSSKSDFHTTESLNKETAWKVILRLGLKEAREWLLQALEGETHFMLLKLGEIASFLQVKEAVKPLGRIVRDKSADYRIGLGCLEILGVLGTDEALDALLESQVHNQRGGSGQIPLAMVEALTSTCMVLRNCDKVWDILRDSNASRELREVCAYVIDDLSTLINAPLPATKDLITLLRTEGSELPGYNNLLLSLSRFREDPTTIEFLRELGETEYESDGLTQALALTGLLIEFPKRIAKLGIEKRDGVWAVVNNLNVTAAFALLHLFRVDPNFELALRQALHDDTFYSALQIIGNLKSSDTLSIDTRQALWNLAIHWNGPNSTHRSSLEAIAHTWPEMLLEDSTVEIVSRWSTSARRAYLSALKTALSEHGGADKIGNLACRFLEDSESDVRRDAARLALESDPAILIKAVNTLAEKHEELDRAVFMLDAAFWLESDWDIYNSFGRSHREPIVREISQRLNKEREGLIHARSYLSIILESNDYLDTWCYGQALIELGNEETVDNLYKGLPLEVYRRHYLIWIAKQLEKRLERLRTEEGKKSYLPPPAEREESVNVTIELKGNVLGPFSGVLRKNQTRRAHRQLWSWSVYIENELNLAFRLEDRNADDDIFINTSDGRRGQVLPIKTEYSTGDKQPKARVLLLGQGGLD